jgi:trimethylamine--corrinoid protein Co-methyltransferase
MDRFDRAFYAPLVADLTNHGSWEAAGARTATERATAIWQQVLADYTAPPGAGDRGERIARFIADRSQAGGAPPPD